MTPISSNSSLSPVADPYDRLKGLAQTLLRNERSCTLTATGLVHELFLKVRKQRKEVAGGFDESELTPFAGRMMRQILIDRARSRATRGQAESGARVNSKPDEHALHELRHKLIELDDPVPLHGSTYLGCAQADLPVNKFIQDMIELRAPLVKSCNDFRHLASQGGRRWQSTT